MVWRVTERIREGRRLGTGTSVLVLAGNQKEAATKAADRFAMFELLLISKDTSLSGYTVETQPMPGLQQCGLYARGAAGRPVQIL